MTLQPAPRRQIFSHGARGGNYREYATGLEQFERRPNQRQQSSSQRQIAAVDRYGYCALRPRRTQSSPASVSAATRLWYPSSRGGTHSRRPSSSISRRWRGSSQRMANRARRNPSSLSLGSVGSASNM